MQNYAAIQYCQKISTSQFSPNTVTVVLDKVVHCLIQADTSYVSKQLRCVYPISSLGSLQCQVLEVTVIRNDLCINPLVSKAVQHCCCSLFRKPNIHRTHTKIHSKYCGFFSDSLLFVYNSTSNKNCTIYCIIIIELNGKHSVDSLKSCPALRLLFSSRKHQLNCTFQLNGVWKCVTRQK